MKSHISGAVLAMAILSLSVSCNKLAADHDDASFIEAPNECSGSVRFRITGCGTPATKASGVTATSAETAVSDVQILIFDSNGNVVSYIDAGTSMTAVAKLKQGDYKARAVINGPDLSGTKTLPATEATGIALADWNSPSSDFVMGNVAAVSLSVEMNKDTELDIDVSRFVSRVRLMSVANGCPAALGGIILKRAFLSNSVCNQNLAGTAAPSDWSNIYGRSSISNRNSVIDGASFTAVPAGLTYYAWNGGQSVAAGSSVSPARSFYSYPNPSSDSVTAWKSTFSETATRLVLVAEVNGNDFYYPVALPGMERNCTYDVSVSITGEGLDDPQGDISVLKEKGTVNASITILPWTEGTEYKLEY